MFLLGSCSIDVPLSHLYLYHEPKGGFAIPIKLMVKILLIDDTTDFRDEMKDILTMEGYEVSTASNGYMGIEVAIDVLTDLIVTDLTMPEMDGYGLISMVNANSQVKNIPILVLSAKIEKECIQKAILLKADSYLTKPCSADELIESIGMLL
jgi:DNA-binding response OmpR family regulator